MPDTIENRIASAQRAIAMNDTRERALRQELDELADRVVALRGDTLPPALVREIGRVCDGLDEVDRWRFSARCELNREERALRERDGVDA